MLNNLSLIGGSDGPTSIFLSGKMNFGWMNVFGLIIIVLFLIPNIIYKIKIKNHFSDIKRYANVIENRIDDEWCTLKAVLADNAKMLADAKKYKVNYVLIDDEYEIDIDL